MSAELKTHGGEQFVGEIRLAPGAKAFLQSRGPNMGGHGLIDGGFDRPPPLPGIPYPAREPRKVGVAHDEAEGAKI